MNKKVGVLIIHGMGDTRPDFHRGMERELKKRLGRRAAEVRFQKCYWQPLLQKRENDLWKRMTAGPHKMDKESWRRWVINALGDPVGYLGGAGEVYRRVHLKVRASLGQLRKKLGGRSDGPLFVIAHSLGSAIISNYLWDEQHPSKGRALGRNKFEKMKSLATLVTLGSNIPLFMLAYKPVECVTFPPPELDGRLRAVARWMNFYDPDDILGYPLNDIWDRKNGTGKIEDFDINTGWWPLSESPYSHTRYWTDNDVTKPVAEQIGRILRALS